jgi:nucleoside-diphosphate-sugar epimerase
MKVFVAGAGGAIGAKLVPGLVADGHEVVAMTRSPAKEDALRALGAEPAIADGLDRAAVVEAVRRSEPEVVIHQMTSLATATDMKNFDREFALTNRLRTEGTDHLLEGARAAGARRLVAQSFGNWDYERTGSKPKTEEDPLDPTPPANQRQSLDAIRKLERDVVGADDIEGVALRYGILCGPGTGFAPGGEIAAMVRKRRLPIVGDGDGVWSFIHVEDAASAAVAAMTRGTAGLYNVADDEPVTVSDWLPELAVVLGAKPPRHVPVWLARLLVGEVGISLMTQIRGASNAKAKRELGWEPRYPTYRESFRAT